LKKQPSDGVIEARKRSEAVKIKAGIIVISDFRAIPMHAHFFFPPMTPYSPSNKCVPWGALGSS
jgi:hypothetical protein